MRYSIVIFILIAGYVSLAVIACNNSAASEISKTPNADSIKRVKRGEYLVATIGCDDCHSPKRMGAHGPALIPELRFSGFPRNGKLPPVDSNTVKKGWILFAPDLTSAIGPWGTSYAANISSDGSGIGNWKEENFIRAMREGKQKGLVNGRPLLPPMPWTNFRNLTDEDLKSMFAYLKTTRPVSNAVPAPKPPTAFK